ncbi:MAG: ABC transporter ATP-binding protein, partial [Candidatus Hydrogenedentota bacterium]
EAVKMGDRVALLDDGQLQQLATPGELVENPANEFVDHFLGQHRFQLSLLTQTIASIVEPGEEGEEPPEEKELRLNSRNSLIEALDMFKKTGETKLPVVKRGEVMGSLTKQHLLEVITKALEETGDES